MRDKKTFSIIPQYIPFCALNLGQNVNEIIDLNRTFVPHKKRWPYKILNRSVGLSVPLSLSAFLIGLSLYLFLKYSKDMFLLSFKMSL